MPLQAFAFPSNNLSPYAQNTAKIDSAALVTAAQNCLRDELEKSGESRRYKLEVVKEPLDVPVPEGKVGLEAVVKHALRYGLTMPVYIAVQIDGKPHRQVVCHVKIRVFDDVAVASRSLRPHQTLTAKDVRIEEREVSRITDRYFSSVESVVGKEINRVVMTGNIYTASMVRNPTVLKISTPVTIVSHQGSIEVRTEGITLSPGRIGAIIRVKNPKSKKIVTCRVIDEKTVEVVN